MHFYTQLYRIMLNYAFLYTKQGLALIFRKNPHFVLWKPKRVKLHF